MEMKLAENRYQQLNTSLDQAEENFRLNSKRYETGMGTSLEVIDAQLALESIKLQRIKSMNDYYANMSSLYRTIGQSVDFVQFWSL
jgi:outer membrane protein TolC